PARAAPFGPLSLCKGLPSPQRRDRALAVADGRRQETRSTDEEERAGASRSLLRRFYIIPPMSGMPPPTPAGCFSGASATIASVVRMFFAIDAAFCSAERTTIVGSVIPALTRSSYTRVSTFRPWPFVPRRI